MVEVPHVEAAVRVAIQAEHALDLGHWRLAGRGQLAAIIKTDHLIGLVAGAPAAQAPGVDAEDIGRLQPAEGTTQGAQDDFLSLHRPLHGGGEPEHRHLLGYRCLYGSPPEKRTFHLLSGADRSCAPYSRARCPCVRECAGLRSPTLTARRRFRRGRWRSESCRRTATWTSSIFRPTPSPRAWRRRGAARCRASSSVTGASGGCRATPCSARTAWTAPA